MLPCCVHRPPSVHRIKSSTVRLFLLNDPTDRLTASQVADRSSNIPLSVCKQDTQVRSLEMMELRSVNVTMRCDHYQSDFDKLRHDTTVASDFIMSLNDRFA